jgi:hypothetical protein
VGFVSTLRIGYPRVQTSSQGNGSHLLAEGSSEAAMCPRGLGSCSRLGAAPGPSRAPAARGSSGAATCHLGSSTHFLAQGSSGAGTCYPGSAGCKQINKYPLATRPSGSPSGRVRPYLPRRYVTRAAPHARKVCSRWLIKYRRDMCRSVAVTHHSAKWFNNSGLQGYYSPASATWATCQPPLRA